MKSRYRFTCDNVNSTKSNLHCLFENYESPELDLSQKSRQFKIRFKRINSKTSQIIASKLRREPNVYA